MGWYNFIWIVSELGGKNILMKFIGETQLVCTLGAQVAGKYVREVRRTTRQSPDERELINLGDTAYFAA